jgi:hypothetical protein
MNSFANPSGILETNLYIRLRSSSLFWLGYPLFSHNLLLTISHSPMSATSLFLTSGRLNSGQQTFSVKKPSKFIITQSFIDQLTYVHISTIFHIDFISYVAIWQRRFSSPLAASATSGGSTFRGYRPTVS